MKLFCDVIHVDVLFFFEHLFHYLLSFKITIAEENSIYLSSG